jgi:hypothetical protein
MLLIRKRSVKWTLKNLEKIIFSREIRRRQPRDETLKCLELNEQ